MHSTNADPSSDLNDGMPSLDATSVTRRGMLTKAAGVAAAAAVGSIAFAAGASSPAGAATGSNLVLGEDNTAEATTELQYDGAGNFSDPVFLVNDSSYSPGDSDFTCAVAGWAGYGITAGSGGVQNGVYGYSDNPHGFGVVASGSGGGLYAEGFEHGPAVQAVAKSTGPALQVDGKIKLSRSGVAHVHAHQKQATVVVAGLTPASWVIATIQGSSGEIAVASVNVIAGRFTILLTGVVTSTVRVAWMILN